MRAGFGRAFADHGWGLDAQNAADLMLLPEMDGKPDVPEISTECWAILGRSPRELMCATSRMLIKRKGAARPTVVPCTLLPYDPAFAMGSTLRDAEAAEGAMFNRGSVKLCHPHCAKFCVLGGGSCSTGTGA
jgi:hypothetical protein